MYRQISGQNCTYNYTYTYSASILCTQFHVACMEPNFAEFAHTTSKVEQAWCKLVTSFLILMQLTNLFLKQNWQQAAWILCLISLEICHYMALTLLYSLFTLTRYCSVGTVWGSSYCPLWISDLSLVLDFSFRYDSLNRRTTLAGWNTSGVNYTARHHYKTYYYSILLHYCWYLFGNKTTKIPQEGENESILILNLPKNLMLVNVELFFLSFYTIWRHAQI